jgi:hypothetical protein
MKKQGLFAFLGFAALSLFLFQACEKDENADLSEQEMLSLATRTLQSQQLVNASFNIATRGTDKVTGFTSVEPELRSNCGSVTVTPADARVFPKIVTVDFGSGCVDTDGKRKSGKFVLTVGKIWEAGSLISIQYDNYQEEGYKLDGKFTFSNNSNKDGGVFQIKSERLKITDAKNETIIWSGVHNFVQTKGQATWFDWSDDVFDITGNVDAEFPNGETISWNIATPLVKANNCYWVGKGLGVLKLNGEDISVDYGSGGCDNKAVLTLKGKTYDIVL